jgi:hypothetical protein
MYQRKCDQCGSVRPMGRVGSDDDGQFIGWAIVTVQTAPSTDTQPGVWEHYDLCPTCWQEHKEKRMFAEKP